MATGTKRNLTYSPEDNGSRQPPGKISKSSSSPSLLKEIEGKESTAEFSDLLKETVATLTARFDNLERNLVSMFERRLERFETRIFDSERKADDLAQQLETSRAKCREKDDKIAMLKKKTSDLENQLNEQEQYVRRENIRIVGLPEKERETAEECEKEVQEFLRKELGIEEEVDISVAHRIGKRKEGESRAVICRLVKRGDKSKILRGKKILREKKSKIYVSEDLTQRNLRLIRDIRGDSRIKSVWTVNCKVMAVSVDGQRLFNLRSIADVDYFLGRSRR